MPALVSLVSLVYLDNCEIHISLLTLAVLAHQPFVDGQRLLYLVETLSITYFIFYDCWAFCIKCLLQIPRIGTENVHL
jgi:hypothetical protein